MTEQTNLVPKRRFKEFQNTRAWEHRELGEVLKVNSGRDYKHLNEGDIPVYGTGGYMLSVDDKLSDVDGIGIGRKGTIDKPQYLKAPFWTVDTLFFMTPMANYDLQFLFSMSKSIKWKQMDESTGVPSLSKAVIEKVSRNFPSYKEQIKIGSFFKQLDKTIAPQQRKLEKLKALKSAYLFEMFPAEGKRVPKRRFAGFTDEWEQHKLGDLMEISSASRVHKNEWTESGVPFFRSSDVVSEFKGTENNKAFISQSLFEELSKKSGRVKKGDVLVTGGGSIGIPYLVKSDNPLYFKDADLIWLKSSVRINGTFLYTFFTTSLFRNYVNSITHIGTISHYTIEQAKDTPIRIPTKEEQTKIGNFFKQLDNTIALYQRKLEKLQNIKKAYLNEMFV